MKFKCHIPTENYVSQNINKYERSLLAKLRSGTLPLAVETGRFKNKQLSQRLCELRNSNVTEDEEHFIVTCPFYKTQRISLFNYISCNVSEHFDGLNSDDQYIKLMTLNNKNLKVFVKYVTSIWDCRKSTLFKI